MRRTEHYTAAPDSVTPAKPETYRDAYQELPLFTRLFVSLRVWFSGASVEESVRQQETRRLFRHLERDFQDVIDPGMPALRSGFTDRVLALAKRMKTVDAVVTEATGNRAGRFLQGMLASLDSETAKQLEAATRVPELMLDDPEVSLDGANAALKSQVKDALEMNRSAIERELDPVWSCLVGLRHLAAVHYTGLLPAGPSRDVRIPLRVVRDDLIDLYRNLEYCRRHRSIQGLDAAADFAARRLGRNFSVYRGTWEVVDDLAEGVPFVELIRLALDEPRITIKPLQHKRNWWATFERAWTESLEAGTSILRHRTFILETILHDDFAVAAPSISWIPAAIYQRSVGGLRRLASGTDFRVTRVFVGTVAREEGLLRLTSKKDLLDAHVLLDQMLEELEELVGSGEDRGKIGEEIKRLNAGTSEASLVRIQMSGMLARYRPSIRTVVNQCISALTTIHHTCKVEEKSIVRAFPRLNATLSDTLGEVTPRYALDLVIHRYRPLVEALQGLFSIEQELARTAEAEEDVESLVEA